MSLFPRQVVSSQNLAAYIKYNTHYTNKNSLTEMPQQEPLSKHNLGMNAVCKHYSWSTKTDHVHVFGLLKKAQNGCRFRLDEDVKATAVQWFLQYKQNFPAMLLHSNKNGDNITGYRTDLHKEFIKVYQE
jgi:hypothetical protein